MRFEVLKEIEADERLKCYGDSRSQSNRMILGRVRMVAPFFRMGYTLHIKVLSL